MVFPQDCDVPPARAPHPHPPRRNVPHASARSRLPNCTRNGAIPNVTHELQVLLGAGDFRDHDRLTSAGDEYGTDHHLLLVPTTRHAG